MAIQTRVFSLSGMHCAACASKITASVKTVSGVRAAFVDFRGSRLTVDSDPGLSSDKLLAAVSSAGYAAQEE